MSKVLVLLVGTNPLPVYVSAKYLIETRKFTKDEIFFICSAEANKSDKNFDQDSTKDYAERIFSFLFPLETLPDDQLLKLSDVGDVREIENNIKEKFPVGQFTSIHLNYTGGTKPMVAASYHYFKTNFTNFETSYLDARSFKMKTGNASDEGIDLRSQIKIDINELITLHDFKDWEDENTTTALLINGNFTAPFKIISKIMTDGHIEAFNTKIVDNIQKAFKFKGEFILSYDKRNRMKYSIKQCDYDFKNKFGQLAPNKDYYAFVKSFPDIHQLIYDEGYWNPFTLQNNDQNILKAKYQTLNFIEGGFLEFYIFSILKKISENDSNTFYGHSLKIVIPDSTHDFEIDNYFIRGYQLFCFTVTFTFDHPKGKRKTEKLKLMESYHRARQIGGDEAICVGVFADTKANLIDIQKDVAVTVGTKTEHIQVLGLEDFPNLGKEIERIIYPEKYI